MLQAMAIDHPFQSLFESLGQLPIAHAESVNRQAYEILYDILSVPVGKPGRCILLRAPRAGHGKTHLLSRIQHHLGASHEFIPLHAELGCQIDTATVIADSLHRLLRPLPASGGLCILDLVTRRLFSAALQPLVNSGEVPCQDREGAISALQSRPIEIFDFHHPEAVTAQWTRENFEVLGQRFSAQLAQHCGLRVLGVDFWVESLFRFASTPVESSQRIRVLMDAVHGGNPSERVMAERLAALLGMLSVLMRVVLVADSLEGFAADETAAQRLASFLGNLRQSVTRLDVILSLNQDIWQNAFVPRLSDGFTDRLSEIVVELKPLTEEEMLALLESRVPGMGGQVLADLDRNAAGVHARGLIRAAGVAWLRATAMDPPKLASATPPPAVAEESLPLPAPHPVVPALEVAAPPLPEVTTEVTPEGQPEGQPEPPPAPATGGGMGSMGSMGIMGGMGGMGGMEAPAPAPVPAPAPAPAAAPAPVSAPAPVPVSVAAGVPASLAAGSVPPSAHAAVDSPFEIVLESIPTESIPDLTQDLITGGAVAQAAPIDTARPPAPEGGDPPHPAEPGSASDRVDGLLKRFLERYGRDNR